MHICAHNTHLALILVAALALCSCTAMTSDPWLKEAWARPERVKYDNEEKNLKLTYLARFLIEDDDRRSVVFAAHKSKLVSTWNAGNYATATQMITDARVNQLSSAQGQALGDAVLVGGLILGNIFDGANNYASQVFIPENFQGQTLSTPKDAAAAVDRFSHDQMQALADAQNWRFECIFGCFTAHQIFVFTTNQNLSSAYIYRPDTIVAIISRTDLVKPDAQSIDSAMLGFPVGWQTAMGNTYVANFFSEPKYDEIGKVKLYQTEKGQTAPAVRRSLIETHIGRDLLRVFYGTPYAFYGNQTVFPRLLVHQGEMFNFSSNSTTKLLQEHSQEPLLLRHLNR